MTTNAEQPVGVVTHWFGRIHVASVRLTAPLAVGDRVHVKGARDDFTARVRSMEVHHQPVERAEAGAEVGIRMPARAHAGDAVLRVEGRPGFWARLLGR